MRDEIEKSRIRSAFVATASWPIGPAELEALVDVGMSDGTIAQYFGVELDEVRSLRARYAMD